MNTYYTKCGRTFEKSTKADTTGYHIAEENGIITDEACAACPFPIEVTDGWGEKATHKRFECRAGSLPPNHENTYQGNADDKCTLRVCSLDHDFCETVIAFAKDHPDLGASYNQDCADGRRTVSVSCSQNKKGMAAKQELIDKFFSQKEDITTEQPSASPITDEPERVCGTCYHATSNGSICIECEPSKRIRRTDPACDEYLANSMTITTAPLQEQPPEQVESSPPVMEGGVDYGDYPDDCEYIQKKHKPQCPFLSTLGMDRVQCMVPVECKILQDKVFDSNQECSDYADHYCYDHFSDCENYREYYADVFLAPDYEKRCISCCHNTWHTGLPDGYSGQEYCFCQLEQKPKKHDDPGCVWFNRHLDWPLDNRPKNEIEAALPVETVMELQESYDYDALAPELAKSLMRHASQIMHIKVRTVYDIGLELKCAHAELSNHRNGTFGQWCESIGISRDSATNYMRGYEFIAENFGNIEDAAGIQPSLLFAASKPSAPPELAQAVIEGDITKHKDYIAALDKLKEAEQNRAHLADCLQSQKDLTRGFRQQMVAEAEEANRLNQALRDKKQQIEQLERNADPEKLKELGDIITEKQQELEESNRKIAELKAELNTRPIPVTASEVIEVIPEGVEEAWLHAVENAIDLLGDLSDGDLQRVVRCSGLKNYHVMKGDFRMHVYNAWDRLKQLEQEIVSAPAPADEFYKEYGATGRDL